ncbi:hypothetical protein SPHINGOAX6_70701 [Sphingomonas sp. AX6]|nr:hypothetical protein SPHINGOAX6_70701 [Sphingomonas sp. AX6]
MPRIGPRRAGAVGRGNERAAPRNGSHPAFGPMQSRSPDMGEAGAWRYREAVRAEVSGYDMEITTPFDPATLRHYSDVAPTYRAGGPGGQNRFLEHFLSKLPARSRIIDFRVRGWDRYRCVS